MAKKAQTRESVMMAYMRVSTRKQDATRQLKALLEFGVTEENIFLDKQSGRDFKRPGYRRMMDKLKKGDVLVVKSIDRLGRDFEEIMEQYAIIRYFRKAHIVSLDEGIDTRVAGQPNLTLMFMMSCKFIFSTFFSQEECDRLHRRQAEGYAVARAKGKTLGRPPKKRPADFPKFSKMWAAGKINGTKAAKALGIPRTTFLLWAGAEKKDVV